MAYRPVEGLADLHPRNMKISVIILLLFVNTLICAGQNADDRATRQEIIRLNRQWNDAIIKRDSALLENLLAPEFTLNGGLPRPVWMSNTLRRLTTTALHTIGEENIAVYGESAICSSTLLWRASMDGGRSIDGEFLVTDIWKKNNGKWQVLIRMSKPK